jgi:hypothetical protein
VAGFFPARLTPERRIVHGGESCLATSMTTAVRTAGIRTVRLERLEWLEDLGISYAIYIYIIWYTGLYTLVGVLEHVLGISVYWE